MTNKTGCLGVNKVSDMKSRYKSGKYLVHVAKFNTIALNGKFIGEIKKNHIDKLNEKVINACHFKVTGTDIKRRPTLADWLSSNEEYICGILTDFRFVREGSYQIVVADFNLYGPRAEIVRELMQDDNNCIHFSMNALVDISDRHSVVIEDLLGFDILGTFQQPFEEKIGITRSYEERDEFV